MVFIHTWKAQSKPLSHEQNVCWDDSMLRKCPVAEPAVLLSLPPWCKSLTDQTRKHDLKSEADFPISVASHMIDVHPTRDSQTLFIIIKARFLIWLMILRTSNPQKVLRLSIMYRLPLLLSYLLAQFCAHRPHTHPQQYRGTKPLFQIASTQSSVVRGKRGHLLSTKDFATFIWGAALSHY